MGRFVFHLPWFSMEGFYWFQQALDQTVFVMSGSWADVTSRELAAFSPSALFVCIHLRKKSSMQLFPKFCCLNTFLASHWKTEFVKWLRGRIQPNNFFCIFGICQVSAVVCPSSQITLLADHLGLPSKHVYLAITFRRRGLRKSVISHQVLSFTILLLITNNYKQLTLLCVLQIKVTLSL